jgi:hypothetical protein
VGFDIIPWLEQLRDSPLAIWVREADTVWAYPTILTLHTVGLGILVGANTFVDLRFLGVGRTIPLEEIRRFFPWMWAGFWLNLVTGLMLFAADPITKGTTTVFKIKLGLVIVGVILIPLMRRAAYARETRADFTVPGMAKAFAALSLLIWVAAIATGRLMAYLS